MFLTLADKTTCNSPVLQAYHCTPTNSSNSNSDSESDTASPSPAHSSPGSDSPIGLSRYCIRKKIGFTESWILTPPPCFTAKGDNSEVEMTEMENLLIEHPSMSVYNSHCSRGSSGESELSTSSNNDNLSCVVARRGLRPRNSRGMVARQDPRRPAAVAARCGIVAQVDVLKSSQRAKHYQETRRLTRTNLDRVNKVLHTSNKKFSQKNRIQTPSARSSRFSQRQHWCCFSG